MRRALLIALAVATLAGRAFGQQVAVDGLSPQLPPALGPLGGLKVECLIGCGGGAVGADVNISGVGGVAVVGGTLPVSGTVAFSNTSIGVTHANFANLDAALSTLANQATLALIKAKTDNLDVLLSTRTKPADAQHAIIDSGSVTFTNASIGITGSVAVTGPLTDTQLRASNVGVSLAAETTKVIGAVNQGTSPWVNNVSQFGGSAVSLGQKPSATSIPVVRASDEVPPSDRQVSGDITTVVNSQSITTNGSGTTRVTVIGTWTGALSFYGYDGTTLIPVKGVNGFTGAPESSTTANGTWRVPTAGYPLLVVLGPTSSGTASISLDAGVASTTVSLDQPIPTGPNVIGALTSTATVNSTAPTKAELIAGSDSAGVARVPLVSAAGVQLVQTQVVTPLGWTYACNAIRRTQCR